MAKNLRARLHHADFRGDDAALEQLPEPVARLVVRDDLVDVVGQAENAIAGAFQPARDLFGACDQLLVIHHMEEDLLRLVRRQPELGLIGALAFGLAQFAEIEPPPERTAKQGFGALEVVGMSGRKIEAAADDLARRPAHEHIADVEDDTFNHAAAVSASLRECALSRSCAHHHERRPVSSM